MKLAYIVAQTSMTIVGVGSAYMSFSVYNALNQLSPILDNHCPVLVKYLPKLPEIQEAFENIKKTVERNMELIELILPILPEDFQQLFKDYIYISPDINEILRYANNNLYEITSYCGNNFKTAKDLSLSYGIISTIVTIANVALNGYLFRKKRYQPLLLNSRV